MSRNEELMRGAKLISQLAMIANGAMLVIIINLLTSDPTKAFLLEYLRMGSFGLMVSGAVYIAASVRLFKVELSFKHMGNMLWYASMLGLACIFSPLLTLAFNPASLFGG
jgi:hypothetical protein